MQDDEREAARPAAEPPTDAGRAEPASRSSRRGPAEEAPSHPLRARPRHGSSRPRPPPPTPTRSPAHPVPATPLSEGTICPRCGTDNRPGIAFCRSCGQRLMAPGAPAAVERPSPPEGTQACPRCGTHNRAGVAFCQNCGANLRPADAGVGAPADDRTRRPRRRRPGDPRAGRAADRRGRDADRLAAALRVRRRVALGPLVRRARRLRHRLLAGLPAAARSSTPPTSASPPRSRSSSLLLVDPGRRRVRPRRARDACSASGCWSPWPGGSGWPPSSWWSSCSADRAATWSQVLRSLSPGRDHLPAGRPDRRHRLADAPVASLTLEGDRRR